MKVALRAGAPIVPCAIVGSEEASAGISRTGWLAERLGIPLLAANSALRLAPAAVLPLPSRWTLRFGDPIEVAGLGREAADDPAVVNALAERVAQRGPGDARRGRRLSDLGVPLGHASTRAGSAFAAPASSSRYFS